jgi:hypothetical protein
MDETTMAEASRLATGDIHDPIEIDSDSEPEIVRLMSPISVSSDEGTQVALRHISTLRPRLPSATLQSDDDTLEEEEPKFDLFQMLPIELRLKVFDHAFPDRMGRVVNILYDEKEDRYHVSPSSLSTL